MRIVKFFIGIPLGFLLLAGLWFALFQLQLGASPASSQWVYDVVQKKQAVAERIQPDGEHRRIVFLGGSNVLFGIDAREIGRELNIPAVNFGLSAVLRTEQAFSAVKQSLKSGDTLVLALEYSNYYYHEKLSAIELDYTLAHDAEYYRRLPLEKKMGVVLSVSSVRLMKGLIARFSPRNNESGTYQVRTIDDYGDETSNARVSMPEVYKRGMLSTRPLAYHFDADNKFWLIYEDFLQWCSEHQVQVMVTFPSYLYFPDYEKQEQRTSFAALVDWHLKRNIVVLGTPYDFMYRPEDMYDTRYHLNDGGRSKRTGKIIELLKKERIGFSSAQASGR
ncbi:MAG: hypothetical protein Q9M30_04580 [Mariprofundaceae bacterium]|nr:hypothetical protein [Mariprofundaceae bacterium]